MQQAIKSVFILTLAFLGTGCSKPFDHTVFTNEHYGPWRSSLGSDDIPCYGRETQVREDCGTHIKVERTFKKNPRTALTPYAREQIQWYAANARQGTSSTFQAGGIIYRLSFSTPRPSAIDGTKTCRFINVKVKPSGSKVGWKDLSGEYCFR